MASRSRAMTLRKTRSRGGCGSVGHIPCITSPFHRMEHGWQSVELRHRFTSWIFRREFCFRLYPKPNVSAASRFPLGVTKSTRQISMARSESGPSATDVKSNKSNRANRICSIAGQCPDAIGRRVRTGWAGFSSDKQRIGQTEQELQVTQHDLRVVLFSCGHRRNPIRWEGRLGDPIARGLAQSDRSRTLRMVEQLE